MIENLKPLYQKFEKNITAVAIRRDEVDADD